MLVIPVDSLLIAIELHFFGYAHYFQYLQYELLFAYRYETCATSTLEVRIASPFADANLHETSVLIGEHASLKIGEATSVEHRTVAAIICARSVLSASGRVDEPQILLVLQHYGVCYLVQAVGCHWAVVMLAYGVIGW